MGLVVGAVVLLGSACLEAQPPAGLTCPAEPGPLPTPPIRTALVGVATSQQLWLPCTPSKARVTNVTITVLDPSGATVASTSTPLELVDHRFATTVEFVPSRAGEWLISAKLEPDRGEVLATVIVLRDRSRELPVRTISIPSPQACSTLEVAGALVGCNDGLTLRVFSDAGLLAEEAPAQLRPAGDVLWTWNTTGVSRWKGDGRTQLATTLGDKTIAVAASEDRLLIDDDGDLWEVSSPDAGTLERHPVLLGAEILATGSKNHVLSVNGGWVWPRNDEACFRGLDSETRCAPFLSFDQRVIGVEGDGFWVLGLQLRFVRFGAGPEPISTSAIDLPFTVLPTAPPLILADQVLVIRPDTLELERWPAFQSTRVTPTQYLGLSQQQIFVFDR